MRERISVTLPKELLESIDREDPNRSAFIEKASSAYLARLEKARRDALDVEIINRNAERFNNEGNGRA